MRNLPHGTDLRLHELAFIHWFLCLFIYVIVHSFICPIIQAHMVFPTSGPLIFWARSFFVVGGCLVSCRKRRGSLASTHEVPVADLPWLWQPSSSSDIAKCLLGQRVQSHPWSRTTVTKIQEFHWDSLRMMVSIWNQKVHPVFSFSMDKGSWEKELDLSLGVYNVKQRKNWQERIQSKDVQTFFPCALLK